MPTNEDIAAILGVSVEEVEKIANMTREQWASALGMTPEELEQADIDIVRKLYAQANVKSESPASRIAREFFATHAFPPEFTAKLMGEIDPTTDTLTSLRNICRRPIAAPTRRKL
jgi:hypothetical protein